jgi:hypothetical protein
VYRQGSCRRDVPKSPLYCGSHNAVGRRDLAQKIAFSNSIDMPMPQVGAATAADRCEQSMEPHMVFIVSINWTDQGIRNVKESPKRSDAARKLAKKVGVDIKELYLSTSRSCI